MASKQGVYSIEVDPVQMRNLIGTLNALPKETQNLIRDHAQGMSKRLQGQLFMFSQTAPTPQAKLVASSMTTPRDRLIRVDIGGTKKVGRKYGGETSKSGKGKKVRQNSAPAGALLWGSEYGSHQGVDSSGRKYTSRFVAPMNKMGYWINPAVDFYTPVVAKEYSNMVTQVVEELGLD